MTKSTTRIPLRCCGSIKRISRMPTTTLKTGIRLYKEDSFDCLVKSSEISKQVMSYALSICQEGISLLQLEKEIESKILSLNAIPAFKGYNGFPYSACLSVNEYIVHGVATERVLQAGDVLSVDLGVIYDGYYSDHARTLIIGSKKRNEDELLIQTAQECFAQAIEKCIPGNSTGDLGHEIHKTVLKYKDASGQYLFDIFHNFQGHGIGLNLHEKPDVPNFGFPNSGTTLIEGMCICIEPVILYRGSDVIQEPLSNGFIQFKTKNGSPSAHYENQVYISHSGPIILTS